MSLIKRCLLALCLIALGWPLAGLAAPKSPPVTILVSIDGFRADYFDRGISPNLAALAARGVRAKAMNPSFPSITFPNHYTLVTGLRPDHNGIVDNTMHDPGRPGVTFNMGNHDAVVDDFWWDQGEPLWVSAQRAGIRSATMFWPGSEAPIHGVRPAYWKSYDKKVLGPARVDQVLAWLSLPPAKRPRFITLYFDVVDTAGHHAGPDSEEVNQAIRDTDAAIGQLVAGLKKRGLYGRANLVIVADHGMAQTSPDRLAFLDDAVDPTRLEVVTGGTMAELLAKDPEAEAAILGQHPHFQCWRKAEVPERFHFGHNPRVPPIVCLAETGWLITTKARNADRPMKSVAGAHGYDPFDPTMSALFIAEGPAIRRGVVVPVFDNVDVYPLVARLVGVPPKPNDGQLPAGVLTSRR